MRRIVGILALISWLWAFFGSAPALQAQDKPPSTLKARDLTAFLIGHAHIDLAWLWRWEETIHDVATHTFWGTLAQMEKMPGLTFAQSQAAIYQAIEKNYPDLFLKIKEKIKEGTWVPVGGMWVEPDLNMPDGEALARQLLYGKRYFQEKFGVDVTVGWNPDSFGHNWQLPQILRKAGITSYVLERCAPEKTPVFWWAGADGSKVLAYVPPGWYLVDLKDGVKDLLLQASLNAGIKDFMLLYGEGDHGGGPRESDLKAMLRFKEDKNHPRLEFVAPEAYFRKLESLKLDYPLVERELNFTFPACYTTQAETKKYNRQLENLLLAAEKFSAWAVFSNWRPYYPERDIDEAWKIVLRQQFHDILDGSSIGPVYEETKKYYEEAKERGQRALDSSLETITNVVNTQGEGLPLLVYNSLAWERTEPVEAEVAFSHPVTALKILDSSGGEIPSQVISHKTGDGAWTYRLVFIAEKVPSFGYKTYRLVESETQPGYKTALAVEATSLENEFFKAALNPQTGWIKSLFDKSNKQEALAAEGNILQGIVDEPRSMSAWELGLQDTFWNIGEKGAKVEILEKGPVRGVIRVKSVFRNSLFVQDIVLYDRLARLDCRVTMDWQERNIMVKAAFPLSTRNSTADFEIPYGYVSRLADGTEVPALKWVDATDESGRYGLSLLNDSRYGFDVKGNVMRISLIHGATDPDPEADRGSHELVYSLYPHVGGWREAKTFRRGYELNNPLLARLGMNHGGLMPPTTSFISLEPDNVVLSSIKKEMGYFARGMLLRVYETFGKETDVTLHVARSILAKETDLIERPLGKLDTDDTIVKFKIKPFEIKTIRVVPNPNARRKQ